MAGGRETRERGTEGGDTQQELKQDEEDNGRRKRNTRKREQREKIQTRIETYAEEAGRGRETEE